MVVLLITEVDYDFFPPDLSFNIFNDNTLMRINSEMQLLY